MEKKALGRGLSALIQPREIDAASHEGEKIIQVPVSQVKTNKYQPRIAFNQQRLNELIESIKEKGVVQPILVRKTDAGYELIAGERRLRAVKSLGMEKMPAIVKEVADVDVLEISLIENIQREELNAMEEANAFQRFITDFGFTQDKIAKVLGKDRTTIANTIRLLGLPSKVQDHISKDMISAGHARALLPLPAGEQIRVANLIVKKGISVRETEMLVSIKLKGRPPRLQGRKDNDLINVENELQRALGTRVRINQGKKRGRIEIEFYSTNDLNRILDLLIKRP